jgi:glycosyltransferase involved in cell wall biosynthesis
MEKAQPLLHKKGHFVVQTVPAVSIVVPHRNQPEHLRRCLASLFEQITDAEIIVVDNGSRTIPTGICTEYSARLVSESVPGPGPARNKGVSVAKAEIIAFIDADCTPSSDWVSTIVNIFKDTDAQIIGGAVFIAYKDPNRLTMLEAFESVFAFPQKEYIERQSFSVTANMAMRRSVYTAVGPFRGIEVAEDRDWGMRATKLGFCIRYIPDLVVFHPARTSMKHFQAKLDRQIHQAYAATPLGFMGSIRWVGLALAIAGSPLFEIRRIYASDQIATWRDRFLAAKALVRIRFYRSLNMLLISITKKPKGIYWDLD